MRPGNCHESVDIALACLEFGFCSEQSAANGRSALLLSSSRYQLRLLIARPSGRAKTCGVASEQRVPVGVNKSGTTTVRQAQRAMRPDV